MKHPTLTNRIGTHKYYFHCSIPKFRYPNNDLTAETEEAAKTKVLQMIGAEAKSDWRFRGECSKNRGFTVETNLGEVTLWHIIRE